MDNLSKEKRKKVMSSIVSKDTKPEVRVRKILHSNGYRFRKNVRKLPGSPDIVLPKYKSVIFVHGCFWHRHTCKDGQRIPGSNTEFWQKKFDRTESRDRQNFDKLILQNYKILTLYTCELDKLNDTELFLKLSDFLGKD